jgi:hypothetical protein
MKRNIAINKFVWLLTAIVTIGLSTSRAQTITHVDFDLPSLDYDVIYLADFIDVTSNKLAKDIPNFSGTIRADGTGQIMLDVTALVQLKGHSSPEELVFAETEPFNISLSRTLTASDLAAGSVSDIKIKGNPYRENQSLRDRIKDYAKQFPTAPVGQYILQLEAYSVTPTGGQGTVLGKVQKVITVRNASPDEVQVDLVEPERGAVVTTTTPRFSWSSPNQDVTLYVYEKLPIYQSPEEAMNGIPCLVQEINGPQTFQYPTKEPPGSQNRLRSLEPNKSYVWFVEASVTTNRQTVRRRSEIRLFRIRLDNRADQDVSDMMGSFGGSAAGTFSTLQSIGWTPTGTITLDGKPVTLDDLKALVAKLVAQNIQVTVRVE